MNSIPPFAASIWTDGNNLMLAFPVEGKKGHTVAIPLERCIPDKTAFGNIPTHHAGFHQLLELLKARARETAKNGIGSAGSPVQYDLDRMLLAFGGEVKKIGKTPAKSDLSLEDLGL